MLLILVAIIVFLVNIPFGYWRANADTFSLQWILSIHLPISLINLLRIYSGIGFEFITYPIIIITFIHEQQTEAKFYFKRTTLSLETVISCLIMDTCRKFRF